MTENGSINKRNNHEPRDLKNLKNSHEFQVVLTGENKKVLEIATDGSLTKILKMKGCNVTRLKIKDYPDTSMGKYADRILEENLENLDLVKTLGSEKYQVILMDNFLIHVPDPSKFLTQLKTFVTEGGHIVCSIPNITHGSVRIRFLNGEFNTESIDSHEHLKHCFTLNSFLALLEDSGYSLVHLCRIEKEFDSYREGYSYMVPDELIDAISRDTEAKTTHYLFKASTISYQDLNVRKWLREFLKITTSDRLKELFEYYKIHFGGELLKQNQDKDAHIASMQSAIKDKDAHIASMQSAIKDKDAHIASMQSAIKDKDAHIASMKKHLKGIKIIFFEILCKFGRRK